MVMCMGKKKKMDEEDMKVDRTLWGALVEEEEEEEEGESSDEEMAEEKIKEGTASVSSVASGVETPEAVPLRKTVDGTGTETPEAVRQPPSLFTVLEEKKVNVGGALFGTSHTYVVPPGANQRSEEEKKAEAKKKESRAQVNVSLKPEELENLDATTLKKKYEQQLQVEKAATASLKQDVSEVFEEETRKKKRKLNKEKKNKSSFKF